NNAGWWAEGQIGDDEFIQGIQFLIQNGIIVVN
ncbi:MAG: peptidase, partial [Nitrosopumilus sp. (ex Thoosa mismalolli)]|nr:peptidase [Nitrosopumilus sp. (ex Thoosa mismalolli)]